MTDAVVERRREAESIRLLVEQVYSLTGYDFRDYALDGVRRRLLQAAQAAGDDSIEALRLRTLDEPDALRSLVACLASRAMSFFRGPDTFLALRRLAVPILRTYPSIRIWHAGCGSGEEAYSLAILLKEEGLLHRARIYATDIAGDALKTAKAGAYPLESLRGASQAYEKAGGVDRLGRYYVVQGSLAEIVPELRQRVMFCEHSLVSDASFNEFHLIVTRDVIRQFNRPLQERVFRLIDDSLCPFGMLALGKQHTLAAHALGLKLHPLDAEACLFRRQS
jgi:chemotaxis protein methyltransferase CheR